MTSSNAEHTPRLLHRRAFLRSATALAGWAATGALLTPSLSQARPARPATAFSLCVVTDQPEEAVQAAERWIGGAYPGAQVRVTMHRLPGAHTGDLAWFRAGNLVDYRHAESPPADGLCRMARRLGLPRPVNTPTLLQFEAGAVGGRPTEAQVFQGELLVERLRLDTDRPAVAINGTHGHLLLSVKARAVSVVGASCRHKTCMNMGPIRTAGASLVCIPSRLTVTLNGIAQHGLDAVTQ